MALFGIDFSDNRTQTILLGFGATILYMSYCQCRSGADDEGMSKTRGVGKFQHKRSNFSPPPAKSRTSGGGRRA